MVRNGCLYLSCAQVNKRSDNTFVLLRNGSYGNVVKFIVDKENEKEFALLNMLKTTHTFRNKHTIFQTVLEINSETVAVPITEISKVSVYIEVKNERFICTVPNLLSY